MESLVSYLVFPAIISLKLVWDLSLHLMRELEVGFRYLKLSIDLVDGNAMVHKAKKADGLSRLEQLLDDFCPAGIEVWSPC